MGWEEVETAATENRHELVLSGADVSQRISDKGLDMGIFDLVSINFLEISHTGLNSVPDEIAKLHNLTNLVLRNNKLASISPKIECLSKLKMLDLSVNSLTSLPEEITKLVELQSLNVSSNQLTEFPDVDQLVQLHILDLSHNHLESLPEGITDKNLSVLAQINVAGNEITEIPDDFYELVSLRVLNISDNKLTELPYELSQCLKLKEISFDGNKLKDRRLLKMGQQCQTKSILDYLSKSVSKKQQKDKAAATQEKNKTKEVSKKDRKKNRKLEQEVEDLNVNLMKICHYHETQGVSIKITEKVTTVRPFIVCCVVRNLDLAQGNLFKRFINLQTKLHDTICQKRNAATIATHDLAKTKGPLVYDARPPTDINITPLFRNKDVSAAKLVNKLMREAEEQRKEKKRNQLSGIHKYLELLKGKPLYPCLVDKDGMVISFPPITNCDATKISEETTSMLLEVTSSTSQEICKNVADELLAEMLELGLGGNAVAVEDEDGAAGGEGRQDYRQQLVVEQVKIMDIEGHMKVVYPSRIDLTSEAYKVIRDYE